MPLFDFVPCVEGIGALGGEGPAGLGYEERYSIPSLYFNSPLPLLTSRRIN